MLVFLGGAFLPFSPLQAQAPDATRMRIASMEQDLQALSVQLRQLTLEIEQLRRENAELREVVRTRTADAITREQLNQAIRALRTEVERAAEQRAESLLAQVSRQIERLAGQTQEAMQALARSIEGQPRATPTVQFSQDFPKEGVAYTVQPGDTLSGIARRFNARVSDIQNANKISDPRQLRAGQHLFIPIREGSDN